MENMESSLDVLDKKLFALEERILGNKRDVKGTKPLADTVVEINNQITTALSHRDSINSIMKRFGQLEEFLDPAFGDNAELTTAAKLELVQVLEPELRQTLASLEWLNKAQSSLNSEQLRGVSQLEGKLEKLTLVYLDKKEQTDAQAAQVHQLIKQYNDIITAVSVSLVQWDQIVTDCELAAIPKKRID